MAKLMEVILETGEAMTVRLANGEFRKVVKGDIVEVADDYKNAYLAPKKASPKEKINEKKTSEEKADKKEGDS